MHQFRLSSLDCPVSVFFPLLSLWSKSNKNPRLTAFEIASRSESVLDKFICSSVIYGHLEISLSLPREGFDGLHTFQKVSPRVSSKIGSNYFTFTAYTDARLSLHGVSSYFIHTPLFIYAFSSLLVVRRNVESPMSAALRHTPPSATGRSVRVAAAAATVAAPS